MAVATELVICSAFTSPQEGGNESSVILSPAGRQVYSITTSIGVYFDSRGSLFFVKPITLDQKNEPSQITYLDSIGVPVPRPVLISDESTLMATPYSGEALSKAIASLENREAEQLIAQVGGLLRHIHQVLIANPPETGIVSRTFSSTAHIVDNFYYKHLGVVSPLDYAAYKDPLLKGRFQHEGIPTSEHTNVEIGLTKPYIPIPQQVEPALRHLISFANELAGSYLDRIRPYIHLTHLHLFQETN